MNSLRSKHFPNPAPLVASLAAALRKGRVVFAIVACLAMLSLSLEAASARASISQSTMSTGDAAQFTISVEGASQLTPPSEINVPGLDIRFSGHSRNMRWVNGKSSVSVDLNYVVQARQTGDFTIPAVEFSADGETLRTQPVGLKVEKGNPQSDSGSIDPNDISFAEITVAKKTAYVGESIPVELRLFVDSRVRWQAEQMPSFEGEGFTKQKMPEPRRESARRNGKEYDSIVFRTAVTPSKAGKISIGPSEIQFAAQIPQKRQGRKSPLEQLFGDAFFDDPIFSPTPIRRMTTKAAAVEIDVKPLPAAGRPKDFSGAVGVFRLTAEGSPSKVAVGDPITMKATISGRGNFDRVNAPAIANPDGWHPYPAHDEFRASDELSLTGTKTFEMAVVPEKNHSAMPVLTFSYFDSDAGQYRTLTSTPAPLQVTGAPITKSPAAADVTAASAFAATPAPEKKPPTNDILGLRYDQGTLRESFQPIYERRAFLLAQLVPAAALLIFLVARLRRPNPRAKQIAQLRSAKAAAWRKLRGECSDAEFLDAAVRFVQLETALATGQSDQAIDAAAAKASRRVDEETAAEIDELFSARAELLYAGAGGSHEQLNRRDRERLISALERFEKGNA